MEIPQIKVISTKEACRILDEHGLKTDPQRLAWDCSNRFIRSE